MALNAVHSLKSFQGAFKKYSLQGLTLRFLIRTVRGSDIGIFKKAFQMILICNQD